ncbi:Pleiotropic drug resistance protein 2 [Hibiscus syriacus]|uniref:Pleiotropic drug resistance protein 2 n=1 Tax=Hibiscus syriacus TaxID=106335 RepID=A0A6A2YMJ7_HIBSY|nr:Pleiotropic drug resistance protein 2 [Hibiscus syriacus]
MKLGKKAFFTLLIDDIDPWLIWGYYVSPMMYGQNAIVMNEILNKRWSAHSLASLFNILFIGALTFLNPLGDTKAVVVDEDKKKNTRNPYSGGRISEDVILKARNNPKNPGKGIVLPFQPLSRAFNHVNYYVDMPSEMKAQGIGEDHLQLLRDVNGANIDSISGCYTKNQATFACVSGYCEQNDIHSPNVTVYESLLYSACFALLPTSIRRLERFMFVDEVMELVELKPLRNALVGLPGVDGLMTEQRKRLTIAVEVVANPSIIFMEEPTSGLDARAAAIVMRTVRNTVDTERTVVCTIHQPSIDIFEAFDELLLMKRGGQVIYAGPLGRHSHKLIEYFEAFQGVPKIGYGYNPATWMLESLLTQCKACFWKQHWSYWRNPQYNAIRFFMTIVISILFGLIFWNKGEQVSRQQDLMNLLGALNSAVLFLGATNASAVQSVVAIERTVFYRERAAGMYSELPYAFAQPTILPPPYPITYGNKGHPSIHFIYTLLLYSMIGLRWTPVKFLRFYYNILTCFVYFTLYGRMIIALTPGH